ncbi:hypothetical protein H5410_046764 [Solanum commersonii]|uniref:Uncharacterized protein n=1 Tax=Solanum commersonii TaxID=4109 RepID=A0A9J5XF89_SOLCO|nr:hypothetical protein H5410_046764 [Solanum commersonii]
MKEFRGLGNCSNQWKWRLCLTAEYLPSRPFIDNNFSSRIVCSLSAFNLFRSRGGGSIGGTGATGGVGAGTESTGVDTGGTLAESGRDLARILACRDCREWSFSVSKNVVWGPSLTELCSRASNTGLLPFPLPHIGGSYLPFLEGLGNASQKYSAMRRLLPFLRDLIFSFKAQYTGTLGKVKAIWRLTYCIRRSSPSFLRFFNYLVPFCSIVTMLCL